MPEPAYFGGTVDRSVGSREVIGEIERRGRKAFAFPDRGACGDALVGLARRGDRIVVMGARDESLAQFARELIRRIDQGQILTAADQCLLAGGKADVTRTSRIVR